MSTALRHWSEDAETIRWWYDWNLGAVQILRVGSRVRVLLAATPYLKLLRFWHNRQTEHLFRCATLSITTPLFQVNGKLRFALPGDSPKAPTVGIPGLESLGFLTLTS